ncbi:hypothetical protein O3M35_003535 [Rhynocoris fuscipes]|uniref:Uncharacterized protein n=1 Tax=Rhynocoris fuscipes TaxID=488301 RepID=A0AAW1CRY0_9HEMI
MAEWGGSERDLAVPKKRRRRQYNNDPGVHDDDDDKDDYMLPPLTSRSSSLLQFETLEKQCDTVFRASASSEQFVHSPSLASSFSFDSLETSRWRFSGSPDSLNEDVASSISSSCSSSSSQLSSSQDERDARSYSSRNSATESFKSSLKSHRSFDSLIMCQEKQDSLLLSAELSQSLNNTAIICEEDTEPIAPPRCLYKTVECLTDTGFNKIINKTDEETSRGQRSAENLSEDSGFGEHIPRGNSLRRVSSSGVFTIAENDDDSSSSSYGSDNGMNNTVKIENKNELNVEDKSFAAIRDDDEFLIIPENKSFTSDCNNKMASRHPVVSTPNLYCEEFTVGENEYELKFPDDKRSLSRAHSFKEAGRREGNLRKCKSRGSNIQITTSFINLTKTYSTSESKVHFSPIVSEVIWNEQVRHKPPTGISTAATTVSRSSTTSTLAANDMDKTTQPNKHKSGIGGFFQRFSLRRLSSRDKKRKNLKKETLSVAKTPALKNDQIVVNNIEDLQMIIPLHGPSEERELDTGKFLLIEQQQGEQQEKHNDENERQQLDDHQQPPPPPPTAVNNREVGIIEVGSIERRLDCKEQTGAATVVNSGGSVVMSSGGGGPLPPTRVAGLLETDLDSTDTNTLSASQQQQQQQGNKKARSLLNLGDGRTQLVPCVQQDQPVDHRAKSMEFLLDKENKFAAKVSANFNYHLFIKN